MKVDSRSDLFRGNAGEHGGVGDEAHIDEEILKKRPHVMTGVDLLHLDFGVDVTVIEEVDVSGFYYGNAVLVGDDVDDVLQRQQEVTLDLRVHVLPLGAQSQQLHQMDVVHEGRIIVDAMTLRLHERDQL